MAKQWPDQWTRDVTQGEHLPKWEMTLLWKNGTENEAYDVKDVWRKVGDAGNALVLYPGTGMTKTGATTVVNYLLPQDFPDGEYDVERRVAITNGDVVKMQIARVTVRKSFNNG